MDESLGAIREVFSPHHLKRKNYNGLMIFNFLRVYAD